jgi:hypothetical protein
MALALQPLPVSADGLAPGTYYVRVNTYFANETGSYTISNSLSLPPVPDDAEPNNYYTEANTLPINSQVTGHIGYLHNSIKDTLTGTRLHYLQMVY